MKRRVLNDQPWDAALKSGRAAAEPNLRINMSAAVCVFILTLSTLNGGKVQLFLWVSERITVTIDEQSDNGGLTVCSSD